MNHLKWLRTSVWPDVFCFMTPDTLKGHPSTCHPGRNHREQWRWLDALGCRNHDKTVEMAILAKICKVAASSYCRVMIASKEAVLFYSKRSWVIRWERHMGGLTEWLGTPQ